MKRSSLFAVVLCFSSALAQAQTAPATQPLTSKQQLLWQKFEAKVAAIDRELDGAMGVAVTDLTTGKQLLLNADEVFPTASSIKLPLLVELYRQDQQGKGRHLGDSYIMNAADLVPDSQVMGGLTSGVTKVTNRDLAVFVVAVSDNSATNVLIDRVGFDQVNAMLDSLGLRHTRLRRKMMDLEAAKQGRENVATPRELASLLESIYRGKILDKAHTDDLLKLLETRKDSAIPRLLPEDVPVANKPGELEGVRTDSGIVFVQNRPFVISVMTSYDRDERKASDAISRIAREAYEMFKSFGASSDYGRVISLGNSH